MKESKPTMHPIVHSYIATVVIGTFVVLLVAPHLLGWLADGINGAGNAMRTVFGS